jgi:hypothetical protein
MRLVLAARAALLAKTRISVSIYKSFEEIAKPARRSRRLLGARHAELYLESAGPSSWRPWTASTARAWRAGGAACS